MREASPGELSVNAFRLGLQMAVEKGKAEHTSPTEGEGRAECNSLMRHQPLQDSQSDLGAGTPSQGQVCVWF